MEELVRDEAQLEVKDETKDEAQDEADDDDVKKELNEEKSFWCLTKEKLRFFSLSYIQFFLIFFYS